MPSSKQARKENHDEFGEGTAVTTQNSHPQFLHYCNCNLCCLMGNERCVVTMLLPNWLGLTCALQIRQFIGGIKSKLFSHRNLERSFSHNIPRKENNCLDDMVYTDEDRLHVSIEDLTFVNYLTPL